VRQVGAEVEKEPPRLSELRQGDHWGGYPYGKYSTDQGLAVGLFGRRFDYGRAERLPFEDLETAQLSYATKGPIFFYGSFDKTHVGSEDLRVHSDLTILRDPFHRYYGLGPNTTYALELDNSGYYFYTLNTVDLENTVRKNISPGVDLNFGLSFVGYSLVPNGAQTLFSSDFSGQNSSGFYGKFLLGITVEARDYEFITSSGYYLLSSVTLSPAFLGTQDYWLRLDDDFRYYIPIIKNRWLWTAHQFRYSLSTANAPLIEKSRLGGQSTFRGLPLSRYVAEYSYSLRSDIRSIFIRMNVFGLPLKAGGGFFVDMGQVGDDITRLFPSPFHLGCGISGFASYFTDDFLGSADLGFAEGNVTLYVGLGHAF
jgi:hypothetical protein